MAEGEYTIAGGLADAQRLARQAQVMAASTAAFLVRAGLRPGCVCLDVGCGDGQVAIAMARVVGPSGRVVGVDVDAEALELGRRAAADAGVDVAFVEADAARPVARGSFDVAYARLLLSHLVDPAAAVRAMRAEVRPGGAVAVEDLFLGTLRSEPPWPSLALLQEVYGETVRAHGGDPTIGPRLPALLAAAGLEHVSAETVVNRMTSIDDKLFLAQLVTNMRGAIVAARAATDAEVDELAAAVEAAAREPGTVFFQARVHQVWGSAS